MKVSEPSYDKALVFCNTNLVTLKLETKTGSLKARLITTGEDGVDMVTLKEASCGGVESGITVVADTLAVREVEIMGWLMTSTANVDPSTMTVVGALRAKKLISFSESRSS